MAAPNTNPATFANQNPPWSLSTLDGNFAAIAAAISHQNNYTNYYTDNGAANSYAVTLSADQTATLGAGLVIVFKASASNTGASNMNFNGTGGLPIVTTDGSALTGGLIRTGGMTVIGFDGTDWQLLNPFPIFSTVTSVSVRQTVLSGPVDSNGYSAFGGSIGATTVTMSGTIVATAASGSGAAGDTNVIGSGTNLSWTGLSTNGTMYLYVDVAAGVLSPGATTLAPIYQSGGTPSNTNGQATFNIQQMMMFVGSGSAAPQTNRVFVGQVTVALGVVSVITWYALLGKFVSPLFGYATSTLYTQAHNIGIIPRMVRLCAVNITPELGYLAGDEDSYFVNAQSGNHGLGTHARINTVLVQTGIGTFQVVDNTGSINNTTAADWNLKLYIERGW